MVFVPGGEDPAGAVEAVGPAGVPLRLPAPAALQRYPVGPGHQRIIQVGQAGDQWAELIDEPWRTAVQWLGPMVHSRLFGA